MTKSAKKAFSFGFVFIKKLQKILRPFLHNEPRAFTCCISLVKTGTDFNSRVKVGKGYQTFFLFFSELYAQKTIWYLIWPTVAEFLIFTPKLLQTESIFKYSNSRFENLVNNYHDLATLFNILNKFKICLTIPYRPKKLTNCFRQLRFFVQRSLAPPKRKDLTIARSDLL